MHALSKLVPVPETLMSPDYRPPMTIGRNMPSTIPVTNRASKLVQPTKSPKVTRSQIAKPKTNLITDNRRANSSPSQQRKLHHNAK